MAKKVHKKQMTKDDKLKELGYRNDAMGKYCADTAWRENHTDSGNVVTLRRGSKRKTQW
jgi:hypothetical protein